MIGAYVSLLLLLRVCIFQTPDEAAVPPSAGRPTPGHRVEGGWRL